MAEAARRQDDAGLPASGARVGTGRFLYILPHRDYFWPGLTGQVAHAQGILQGMRDEFATLTLLSAPEGRELLAPSCPHVRFDHPVRPGRFWTSQLVRRTLALRTQVDHVVIRSEPRFLLLLALARLVLPRWPVVAVEVNGLGFTFARSGGGNPLLIAIATLLYRLLLRPFDVTYVVNDDLGRRLSSGFLALPRRKVTVVHNGGPDVNYLPASEPDRQELHVFFFGLLHPYNDFACLLDAADAVRAGGIPVTVHVAGEGVERAYLERRARDGHVRLYGRLSRDEFAEIVRGAPGKRVGIAPMKFGNGTGSISPLKAFDYMALGMPLLYSDNILRDILTDGVHGIAYRERDAGSLAAAMRRVVETPAYEPLARAVRELYPAHTWSARMHVLAGAMRRSRLRT